MVHFHVEGGAKKVESRDFGPLLGIATPDLFS
jgi:hypothetical protein